MQAGSSMPKTSLGSPAAGTATHMLPVDVRFVLGAVLGGWVLSKASWPTPLRSNTHLLPDSPGAGSSCAVSMQHRCKRRLGGNRQRRRRSCCLPATPSSPLLHAAALPSGARPAASQGRQPLTSQGKLCTERMCHNRHASTPGVPRSSHASLPLLPLGCRPRLQLPSSNRPWVPARHASWSRRLRGCRARWRRRGRRWRTPSAWQRVGAWPACG